MSPSPSLPQYPFTPDSFLLPGGHSLSFLDEGKGRLLVFLHGNPTWSYLYRNLISELGQSNRCIAPDHLGCGLSDKPQDHPYRLVDHVDNLERLLEHLGVEKCVLVMHDWGGAIGMGWATRHPEKVEGLVVMNTAAFRSKLIPLRIALCRWPGIGPLIVRGLNGFAGAAVRMAVTKTMAPEIARGFLHPYNSWASRVAVLRFVEDIPLDEAHPSWPELVRIENGLALLADKPMLICWGGKDFCFNDHFFAEWQQRFPEAETLYLPEAGHYLLEDEFDVVRDRIRNFVGKLDENKGSEHAGDGL